MRGGTSDSASAGQVVTIEVSPPDSHCLITNTGGQNFLNAKIWKNLRFQKTRFPRRTWFASTLLYYRAEFSGAVHLWFDRKIG